MLNSLRNSVGTIWAKILLGLLVAAFAAWGIDGVFTSRQQTVIATVGDAKIESVDFARQFQNGLAGYRRITQTNLTVEAARQSGFDLAILNEMHTEAALDEEAKALQIAASDAEVARQLRSQRQFFGASGTFDMARYQAFLDQSRMRRKEYEEGMRKQLARRALEETIANGTTASRALTEAVYAYENEKRSIEHFTLTPDDVEDPGEPSAEALAAFHKENAPRYTAPEYRKITYLALTVPDFAKTIEISDEELKAEYDSRIAIYTTPERRNLEVLVFVTEEEADDVAMELADGASFAKIAERLGKSASDVSLGWATKSAKPDALNDAAFAAEEPGIVGPVGTKLGWSVLNLKAIEPEVIQPFDDVKEALRTTLSTTRARVEVPGRSVQLDDQLAGGVPLEEAAKAVGARYAEVAAVDATGRNPDGDRIADLPENPTMLERAFSTNVDVDPVIIDDEAGGYYALRVQGVTPSALRPLEDVKSDVEGAWEVAEREAALAVLTAELAGKLNEGVELSSLADELDVTVKTTGPGVRSDGTMGLSAPLLDALFAAKEGDVIEGEAAGGLSRIVGKVAEIIPATTSDDDIAGIDRKTEQYAQDLARDFVGVFSNTARERHPLTRNVTAMDNLFSSTGPLGY